MLPTFRTPLEGGEHGASISSRLASLLGCWVPGHLLAEPFDVFADRGSKLGGDLREVFSAFLGVN